MSEELLRRAFRAQAERVEPSPDALSIIRSRIQRHRRLSRRVTMGLASISSAAVATVTAVLVGTLSCAPPPTTPEPPGGTASPSTTASPDGTTSPDPGTGSPGTVPVYYLGTVGDRVVLYREFRSVTRADTSVAGSIAAAVAEMLRGDPLDPDYTSQWPAGSTVRSVRTEGGVAVVDLGGIATNSVGAETAELTVQQLVWTATAAAADAGSPVDGVRLLVDGSARTELWGHVATGGVLRRGASTDVLAPVWLIAPQQGATVGRNVRVHIAGTVFEATAHLRVQRAGGSTVEDRSVMLSAGAPGRGEAFVDLTLAPGSYTIEAFYFSAEDGSVQAIDDHEIMVT